MGSCITLTVASAFTIDSTTDVIPPTVTKISREIYQAYVRKGSGPEIPSLDSLRIYQKYLDFSL